MALCIENKEMIGKAVDLSCRDSGGRYSYLEQIGSGTFGDAWLVKSTASGRQYVIKEIKVTAMADHERNQSVNEVAILSRCKHFNIIRYREAFIDQPHGTLNIVMEFADGGDLYARICEKRAAGGHFVEHTILNWFVQITFAVQYLHSNNILHRDLKTQNIFLTKANLVKVGDFGIARTLRSTNDLATTAIGTPYYLSPEICQRQPYNHKSDQWAVGCVLYEMCCLQHPFNASDFESLVLRILQARYASIPSCYSGLVKDLITILLRSQPDRRPSAEQVLMIPAMKPYVDSYLNWQNTALLADQTAEGRSLHSSASPTSSSSSSGVHSLAVKNEDNAVSNRLLLVKKKNEKLMKNSNENTERDDQQISQLNPIQYSPDSLEASSSCRINDTKNSATDKTKQKRILSSNESRNFKPTRNSAVCQVEKKQNQVNKTKTAIPRGQAYGQVDKEDNTRKPAHREANTNNNQKGKDKSPQTDLKEACASRSCRPNQVTCRDKPTSTKETCGKHEVSTKQLNCETAVPISRQREVNDPSKKNSPQSRNSSNSLFKQVLRSKFCSPKASDISSDQLISGSSQTANTSDQRKPKSPAKLFTKSNLRVVSKTKLPSSTDVHRSFSPVGHYKKFCQATKNKATNDSSGWAPKKRRSADNYLQAVKPKSTTPPKRYSLDSKKGKIQECAIQDKAVISNEKRDTSSINDTAQSSTESLAACDEISIVPENETESNSMEISDSDFCEKTLQLKVNHCGSKIEGSHKECHRQGVNCCSLICVKCRHNDDVTIASLLWQCRDDNLQQCAKLCDSLMKFLSQRVEPAQLKETAEALRHSWKNTSSLSNAVWRKLGVHKTHLAPVFIRMIQLENFMSPF